MAAVASGRRRRRKSTIGSSLLPWLFPPQKKREGKKLSNFWIESVEEGGREGPQRRRREKDKKRGLSEKKIGEIEVGIHAP